MSRRVQVFILCEDLQSQVLLRQFLIARGFPPRALRFDRLPAACGSQWVRERYASAVRINRTRHVAEALIVHIDADNHLVAERHAELGAALTTAGQSARSPTEAIALIVPRWETETWLHHFVGRADVQESHRGYPKFANDQYAAAKPTAEALLACLRGTSTPPANLPSFTTAVTELTRLP